jgi:hypothetical protein
LIENKTKYQSTKSHCMQGNGLPRKLSRITALGGMKMPTKLQLNWSNVLKVIEI